MLERFFAWVRGEPLPAPQVEGPAPVKHASILSTHALDSGEEPVRVSQVVADLVKSLPRAVAVSGTATDSADDGGLKMATDQPDSIGDALASWYASQSFIGHQLCGILTQNWLINKACHIPARDAARNGWDIVTEDGDEVDPEIIKKLRRADRRYGLKRKLVQFVYKGRMFGIRIAMFKVDSDDPNYYENPFNIDGVGQGKYLGIVQVDPYWCAPQLDAEDASRPDSLHFYEPTYWLINGRRVHRSHLVIFRGDEVADILKPQYQYGGLPVPQKIMERVYAAERVANEAPQLAQTKRTIVWMTNLEQLLTQAGKATAAFLQWIRFRDNYGVKLGDKDADSMEQFDTSLSDLDNVIMTQYQIVAGAANIPATKLLGTSPKGFNSTGEFEEATYHEELEGIQEDMTPLIERHYQMVLRSEGIEINGGLGLTPQWRPLDAPTAKELADTNLVKAQTGQALVNSGAIDSTEERRRVAMDPTGGYASLGLNDELPESDDEGDED